MKYARSLSLASETSSLRSIEYVKGFTMASAHHERSRGATNHNVGRSLSEPTGLGNPREVKRLSQNSMPQATHPRAGSGAAGFVTGSKKPRESRKNASWTSLAGWRRETGGCRGGDESRKRVRNARTVRIRGKTQSAGSLLACAVRTVLTETLGGKPLLRRLPLFHLRRVVRQRHHLRRIGGVLESRLLARIGLALSATTDRQHQTQPNNPTKHPSYHSSSLLDDRLISCRSC